MQEECLWMTNFGRILRHLKTSTKKLYYSNLNKILQDDCVDRVINVLKIMNIDRGFFNK